MKLKSNYLYRCTERKCPCEIKFDKIDEDKFLLRNIKERHSHSVNKIEYIIPSEVKVKKEDSLEENHI